MNQKRLAIAGQGHENKDRVLAYFANAFGNAK
jgi:hypothetical protein